MSDQGEQGPGPQGQVPPGGQQPPPWGQQPPPAWGQQPPPTWGQQPPPGWGAPGAPTGRPHPNATTVLVLGIVALAGGLLMGLPLVIGPFAWVMGRRALREIDADPTAFTGRDNVQIGMVLGIAATIFLVLAVLVVLAVLGLFGGLLIFSS